MKVLPVQPVVSELDRLPANVLLALGSGTTRANGTPIFNMPAVLAELLGNWSRVSSVFNLSIWAPGWDADQLVAYIDLTGKQAPPRNLHDGSLRAQHFLDLTDTGEKAREDTPSYEIVHCIGEIGLELDGQPSLLMSRGLNLEPGRLRDALVRCKTRMLILHSLGEHRHGNPSERLAELIAGGGGPAVLTVAEGGASNLDAYFLDLYGRILRNQPLDEGTGNTHNANTLLVSGVGGDQLLSLDGLVEQLDMKLADYSDLVEELLSGLGNADIGCLQASYHQVADDFRSLRRLEARITIERERLIEASKSIGANELEGAVVLSSVAANLPDITEELGVFLGEGPLHTKFDDLKYWLKQASSQGRDELIDMQREQADVAKDNDLITVFFGTNRSTPDGIHYGSERGSMHFGRCLVNVPSEQPVGTIPRPSIWTLYREDVRKHFVVLQVAERDPDSFVTDLRSYVELCKSKQALVFVHGFNVKFLDAIFRTAQIASDLKFPGVAITFSWPSKGRMSFMGYTHDEDQVLWTLPDLTKFLQLVAEQSDATMIHLVAHSMGNRALTDALARMGASAAQRGTASFNEVILTAPDIDADRFARDVVPAILPTARRVTLYASSNDHALKFSRRVHTYPRAGESGGDIVLVDGVDTIDVSSVNTGFVGHFYYGNNRSVLSDIFSLIEGVPAAKRFGLLERTKGDRSYWEFKPG